VAEEAQKRCVTGDAAVTLHDLGRSLLDGLRQFDAAIESMNPQRQLVAGFEVRIHGVANFAPGNRGWRHFPLQASQRLTNIESERRV
jgi:hypothetical protein